MTELALFHQWERTLADLLDRTSKFPKSVRFTFSGRIDNLALDIIEEIVLARYNTGKKRVINLQEIDQRLARLRVLLRIAHGQGFLDHRGYEFTSRRVDEAGRMVGGWLQGMRSE